MQASVEVTSGLERRMVVEIPESDIQAKVDARINEFAKKARIDGFRPGKVPVKIIRQRFGSSARHEVISELINEYYSKALSEQDLNPAGPPSVEPIQGFDKGEFSFAATFEVYPEVELVDLAAVEIAFPSASVTDEDLDTMIESLKDQNASWEAVDRPAELGDQVTLDYSGSIDGEKFEGGTAEGHKLVLGSNSFIPGFEDGVVGVSAGEEKVVEVSFPDDYQAEHLAGKAAEFAITAHEVAEKIPAELNDEFYAKFGVNEGGEEAFRAEVRSNMERELANASGQARKTAAMTALADAHEVDLPKAVVKEEIGRVKQDMFKQYAAQATQMPDLSNVPDEPFVEQAEQRVKLGLLVSEVIKAHDIQLDQERVQAEVEKIASTYEQSDEVINYYLGNEELMSGLRMKVLEDQVVDKIVSIAKVEEQPSSYTDVIAATRNQ